MLASKSYESQEVIFARFCPKCEAQREFCDCNIQSTRIPNALDAFSHDTLHRSFGPKTPPKRRNYGHFSGVPYTTTETGSEQVLLEAFSYADKNLKEWVASVGARISHSSIPCVAWPLVGNPYWGKYRSASVMHDIHCGIANAKVSWQSVHLMYYNALMASQVDILKAKALYYVAHWYGPRWGNKTIHRTSRGQYAGKNGHCLIDRFMVNRIARFVVRTKPTLEEIQVVSPELLGPHHTEE